MALQVWLPLNGNLNNQGLTNVTVTNSGATVDNNGKIGKCYNFDGTYVSFNRPLPNPCSAFTVCGWVKLSTGYATNYGLHLVSFETSYGRICISKDGHAVRVLLNYNGTTSATGSIAAASSISANVWNHYAVTFDSGKINIYINGQLDNSYTVNISQVSITSSILKVGTYGGEPSKGCVNDFKLYDHALSPKEIEVLSRGLVCHYPLSDRSNQTPNNVFTNSTFTSSSGWGFWGQSGHSGTWNFTQNKDYIFNKTQTNACVISNGASATGDYLMYQSPAFSGGFRSLQAIIKEENSGVITDSIAYPVWNASTSGSTPLSHWTSINDLGDGFYLCRCEGIKQDGSNNLVGIYVKPGYKIYVSECYCENDRTVCSDFFYPSTTVYDTSGYQNNGTINGSLSISNDTPRYSMCTSFNGTDNSIRIPLDTFFPNATTFTINLWFKKSELGSKGYETLIGGVSGFEMDTRSGTAETLSLYMTSTRGSTMYSPFDFNKWYMVTMVCDGTNELYYVNGALVRTITKKGMPSGGYWIGAWNASTGQNYKGLISDVRIYATALSAAQVAELYNTAVSVANNGTLMGYELVEV